MMKVLVVDDHVLIREALRGVLKEFEGDAAIFDASSGRQAMRLIEEHRDFSLILLDLSLPDRDGFALLSELRERYPAVSIVVLSALNDRDNVVKALDLGPFNSGYQRQWPPAPPIQIRASFTAAFTSLAGEASRHSPARHRDKRQPLARAQRSVLGDSKTLL